MYMYMYIYKQITTAQKNNAKITTKTIYRLTNVDSLT